jgi:hypothetical protein
MAAVQMTSSKELTLTLTQEEREQLLRILEQALRDKHVEVHRTEAPNYREYVQREEALLERLVDQLRRP